MQYSELAALSPEERREVLKDLPLDELADFVDQKPYELPGFTPRDDRQYFDDIESLHAYLLKHIVPASKPWQANETASHELGHARCALAVGACGVKYYALSEMDETTQASIFTHAYGPIMLPNLAWAAISIHPYTAGQSIADMRSIQSCGYTSREHVAKRIAIWNIKGNDLYIPEPQTTLVPYP